jgi:uncharacterized repeat protein (TIGR03943 family)
MMKQSFKPLLLIALGIFLYTRFANGTLLFYINQRFAWLTLLAAVGLLLVAASYRQSHRAGRQHPKHQHGHAGPPSSPPEALHRQTASWGGLLLVALPIALGLLVPPRPLGATAMQSREVNIGSLSSAPAPANQKLVTVQGEKDILEWLIDFQRIPDPAAFDGQAAQVIGFVYRDDRFTSETFMVSRFAVSCCVADATAVGLIVRWPQADALEKDQWVEVGGHFEAGNFSGEPAPVLVAESITPVEIPNQPYLYYY